MKEKLQAIIRETAVSSPDEKSALKHTIDALSNYVSIISDDPSIEAAGGIRAYTESALRKEIIDPILLALGWDVENRKRVRIERRVDYDLKADYILLHSNGAAFAVIEAKNLDEKLKIHEPQLFGYMDAAFSDTGILTNGFKWVRYERMKIDQIEPLVHFQDIIGGISAEEISTVCKLIGFKSNNVQTKQKLLRSDPDSTTDDDWVEFKDET